MKQKTSRPARIADATGIIQTGLDLLTDVLGEYQDWFDNMPENLHDSPLGEKLQETIHALESAQYDLENTISEVEGLDLPRGFGRD